MERSIIVSGCLGMAAWILLFCAGLTLDSKPYREMFAPPKQASSVMPVAAQISSDMPVSVTQPSSAAPSGKSFGFLAVLFLYTPLNAAILSLLSGLVGGCASRLSNPRSAMAAAGADAQDPAALMRQAYLQESPVASMLRGFLVYLAFIAGIYITTTDPFENPTADQYVRLAGTLSFVSFGMGYDPTRFQELLGRLPKIGSKQ